MKARIWRIRVTGTKGVRRSKSSTDGRYVRWFSYEDPLKGRVIVYADKTKDPLQNLEDALIEIVGEVMELKKILKEAGLHRTSSMDCEDAERKVRHALRQLKERAREIAEQEADLLYDTVVQDAETGYAEFDHFRPETLTSDLYDEFEDMVAEEGIEDLEELRKNCPDICGMVKSELDNLARMIAEFATNALVGKLKKNGYSVERVSGGEYRVTKRGGR